MFNKCYVNTKTVAFRAEMLQERSQVNDSYGLKVEGKNSLRTLSGIEVRPKCKKIPPKQTGISYISWI